MEANQGTLWQVPSVVMPCQIYRDKARNHQWTFEGHACSDKLTTEDP